MQQFVYHSGTSSTRRKRVGEDFPTKDFLYLHLKGNDASIKIKDIRDLTSTLATTSTRPRLVWIEEAHALTIPSQHALLKIVEEPPSDTTFVLTLPTARALLPTILSRCQVISLPPLKHKSAGKDILAVIKQALSASPGERLELAHSLGKNRPETITILSSLANSLHQIMQTEANPRSLSLLANVASNSLKTIEKIEKNTNVTLSLEHFFLTLPQVKEGP